MTSFCISSSISEETVNSKSQCLLETKLTSGAFAFRPGLTDRVHGISCARLASMPESVCALAAEKSKVLEDSDNYQILERKATLAQRLYTHLISDARSDNTSVVQLAKQFTVSASLLHSRFTEVDSIVVTSPALGPCTPACQETKCSHYTASRSLAAAASSFRFRFFSILAASRVAAAAACSAFRLVFLILC